MQLLILSDIHANWYALTAVLDDAQGLYEQIICCGDLVGYNPHPGRVIDWTEANCASTIRGNHDKVVADIDDLEWFNQIAQRAVLWTREQLNAEQLKFLELLPKGPMMLGGFAICHGAPFDEDEYVLTPREASACFTKLEGDLVFFGHTHLQGGFFLRKGRIGSIGPVGVGHREKTLELEQDSVYMINPGSVGQPRDGDPRAAYALYDSDKRIVQFRRVDYPIAKTADDIKAAGLPDALWLRLFQGV